MSKRRCCARCKTPYNCGNPVCPCHAGTPEDQAAWAAAFAEAAPEAREARYHMDHYRGHRDPNGVDGGFGPVRKGWGD